MKKFLLLICALVSAFTTAFADKKEVTFDFSDPTTLSPSVAKPGISEDASVNDTIFYADGVKISFAQNSGSIPCRIFTSTKGVVNLRLYKTSTMTVTAPENMKLLSVTFVGTLAMNTTVGTFQSKSKSWTGSESSVVFTNTGTSQITSMTVVYGDESDTPDPAPEAKGDGTLENPYNATAANNVAAALESGAMTDTDVYVKGIISSVTYTYSTKYGTATFNISENGKDAYSFLVYGALYLDNTKYADDTKTNIKVGDEVVVCGKLMHYVKDNVSTYETASSKAYLYSLNDATTGISNTVAAPYAAAKSIYTLDGRRVAKAAKGIHIINGKKVLVK